MARLLTILLGVLVLSSMALADTTWVAAGGISGNWTREHSPYMIQGDIAILQTNSLEVGPGVKVFFAGYYGLRVDSNAFLTVSGVEGDSVRFTTDILTNPERWKGVSLWTGSTSHMAFTVIEYGVGGWDVGLAGGALHLNRAIAGFDNCAFRLNGQDNGHEGGGMYAYASQLTLRNCLFEENRANNSGALSLNDDWGTVEDCIFRNNHATRGGALECWSLQGMHLRNCIIEENVAELMGGGVWCEVDETVFDDCTIRNNYSPGPGGGLAIVSNSHTHFTGCTISDNRTDSLGGGVFLQYANAAVLDLCVIDHNSALCGGGIFIADCGPVIVRSTIVFNSASIHGGGIYCDPLTEPTLIGTIVAFNGPGDGISFAPRAGFFTFCNCDFFGNAAGNFYNPTDPGVGRLLQVNANGDSCDGFMNINLDPLFADTTTGNYHLTAGSPCIDAGAISYLSPRDPDHTISDIGAFYFDQSPAAIPFVPRPASVALSAYPNPFNPTTRITFTLPRATDVRLEVYDLLGRLTATLARGRLAAGDHSVSFDGSNLPSGLYVCRLVTDHESRSQKILLLK